MPHLGKGGLSGGSRSCHKRQSSDHEPLNHRSDEHGAVLSVSTIQNLVARQALKLATGRERQRNFCSASVVSRGRSSSIQCPVSFSTTTVTSVATSLVCCASASPSDFWPPMVSTGMVSFV